MKRWTRWPSKKLRKQMKRESYWNGIADMGLFLFESASSVESAIDADGETLLFHGIPIMVNSGRRKTAILWTEPK